MENDLISRSAAIEAIEKHIRTAEEPYQLTDADKVMNHAFEIAASCVYNLSAAQPERKRGQWIYNSPVTMKCDQCGLVIKDWDWHRFKFCPNCDCDMRGEQDG